VTDLAASSEAAAAVDYLVLAAVAPVATLFPGFSVLNAAVIVCCPDAEDDWSTAEDGAANDERDCAKRRWSDQIRGGPHRGVRFQEHATADEIF
jgi:hypothetical protein